MILFALSFLLNLYGALLDNTTLVGTAATLTQSYFCRDGRNCMGLNGKHRWTLWTKFLRLLLYVCCLTLEDQALHLEFPLSTHGFCELLVHVRAK